MRALGFDVTLHRLLAFGLAAFVAGIAGVLSVWYNSRITPGSINLEQTINILIIAVIGGLYRLEGAWIGALAYALIDNYSREWVPDVGNVLGPARFNTIIGVVFLIIVLMSPGGLVGIWEDVRDRLARAKTRRWDADDDHNRRARNGPCTRHCQLRGEERCFEGTQAADAAGRWLRGVRRRGLRRRRRRARTRAGIPRRRRAGRSRSASCRTARARSARSSSRPSRARTWR